MAIDQIAQSGLSSLKVIYYSAQLFRVFHALLYMSQSSEVGDVSYVGTVRRIAVIFLHVQYPRAAGQHFVDYYTGNNTKYRKYTGTVF
ncbi:hypothetical protein A9819_15690 [Escherichia coli]|nr:hypothetical protein [Escherichia coli O157]EFO1907616.1 hypothetical protein [Escherichia coli]EFO1912913.1 hypothetical protein [Escherichia coli O157]PBT40321.1 hypothetical protein A9819_15690 [Escherichia coli]